MLTVAYLANLFPSPVEPYVSEEVEELRGRGIRVITGSVRKSEGRNAPAPQVILQPVGIATAFRAAWLCLRKWKRILPFVIRILFHGTEGPIRRLKALAHTWLGACYAVRLRGRKVDHIHVHHGYFGSWVAMVAARLLGVKFSMTLHGSDLLLHGAYLDEKLVNCAFCLTISEHNRQYILEHPEIDPRKVIVSRLGVDVTETLPAYSPTQRDRRGDFTLLAVGRLHKVKDHRFLVRACAQLKAKGVRFECQIAGDGPERRKLQALIRKLDLEGRVTLLGHVPRQQMNSLYARADVVVLTSRSEGIPIVLMEAMAQGKIVLAPAITGIPELVLHQKTGFVYQAGCMEDFLRRLVFIHSLLHVEVLPQKYTTRLHSGRDLVPALSRRLDWIRHAARVQVRRNFHRKTNLKLFGDLFIPRIAARSESLSHENPVLQQIQLPLQRDRSLPIRIDGPDAPAGSRSRPVLHG